MAGPGKRGYECKLTPELHQRIVSYLRAGNFRITAAAAAGITPVTFRDWLRRGARGEEEKFVRFLEDVMQAEAMAEARDVALISKHAEQDWKAAAWRLERKVHRRWGRRDVVEPQKNAGKRELTQEEMVEALELAKRLIETKS